jgi:hypothetical protein
MKKLLVLFLILFITAGCTEKPPEQKEQGEQGEQTETLAVDYDFTKYNTQMRESLFNSMVGDPDSYVGKVFRVRSEYIPHFDDETGQIHHFVIVEGLASCGPKPIEFMWSGERVYPDDYPQAGTIIEVTGVLGSYGEMGFFNSLIYLTVDDIVIIG